VKIRFLWINLNQPSITEVESEMKNSNQWFPTKYEFKNKKLRGSRNTKFLSVSSRLMTDITASFYQQYISTYAAGILADLGCGNVPFYEAYKSLVSDNICVDWPNSAHQNQYLDCTCDLNQPLPFQEASFDTIIISEVLEHIANPEMIWSEMARTLKHNGKILLSVPFLYRIHEAPYDYYRYTEFALRYLAKKNGLEVIVLKSFGGVPEVLADILSKNFMRVPWIGKTAASILQRLCFLYLKTGFGKKMSDVTGKTFPLGYFMVVEKK
jgi:SAM-dependent methyltransferase